MSALVTIKPELRRWIEHNLERGCPPEQLIEGMIAQRFDPPVARGLVRALSDARASGVPFTADTLRIEMGQAEYLHDPPRLAAGNAIRLADRTVSVMARMARPFLAVLAEVMSQEECHALMALARPHLRPSTIVEPATGRSLPGEHRNSEGMFFLPAETPLIAALDARFAELMRLPLDHGEGLQVLRYGPGTQFKPHHDFLVPRNPASEQSLRRSGQRVSSLVVYLNDVKAGGETVFPHAGLSVSPRPGNAVYFEYCNARGHVDAASLHAGAPVIEGEKWAVTKWMRERPFRSAADGRA